MLILETVYDVIVTYAPRYGFWPSWPPSPYLARVKLWTHTSDGSTQRAEFPFSFSEKIIIRMKKVA